MNPNGTRKTNIIDDAVGLAESLAQTARGKGKGKGRAKAGAIGGRSAPTPRSTGPSKSKAPNRTRAAPLAGQRYYEAHGLKIPLHDNGGRQRPHARASTTFRNKNVEVALDIVESYAGAGKRHQFKNESKSKFFIGNWIEMAETLAFGVNPSTKLTSADWAASEFTHPIEHPQSLASASGLKGKKNPKQVPVDDGGVEEDGLEDAVKDIWHSLPKKRKHTPDEASDQNDRVKQQKCDHPANFQPLGVSIANKPPIAKLKTDKRIPDNAYIPTSPAPTPVAGRQENQNQKCAEQLAREKRNMQSYSITSSIERKRRGEGSKHVVTTQDSTEASESFGGGSQVQASTVPVFSGPIPTLRGNNVFNTPAEEQERLRVFMHETGLDPRNAETATVFMHGPGKGERQILTVAESARGQLTLHSTVISKASSSVDGPQNTKSIPGPYLKNGRHGPGGKFDSDPDRATGQGHDYEPEDARNFATYLETRWKAGRRQHDGKLMFPQAAQSLRDLEPWYMEYVKQYPGKRLDQWPCGCMKVVEEDGSESEED